MAQVISEQQVSSSFVLKRDRALSSFRAGLISQQQYFQKLLQLCKEEKYKFSLSPQYTSIRFEEWEGTLHRISHGKKILGNFLKLPEGKWESQPYYQGNTFLIEDCTHYFDTIQEAADYIINVYELGISFGF